MAWLSRNAITREIRPKRIIQLTWQFFKPHRFCSAKNVKEYTTISHQKYLLSLLLLHDLSNKNKRI